MPPEAAGREAELGEVLGEWPERGTSERRSTFTCGMCATGGMCGMGGMDHGMCGMDHGTFATGVSCERGLSGEIALTRISNGPAARGETVEIGFG